MRYDSVCNKIKQIIASANDFLNHQKSVVSPGYYNYSYSCDLYSDDIHWNVGSSVYALKIMYTLGYKRDNQDVINACYYIDSFMHKNRMIYDDMIKKKAGLRNFLSCIKHRQFGNLMGQEYIRAESRQCYSAELSFDRIPKSNGQFNMPSRPKEIEYFLERLNWDFPWGAGSHFSHLLFFQKVMLKIGQLTVMEYEANVSHAIEWIARLQNPIDGAWYRGKPEARQIINGAMKVISGLRTVDRCSFDYSKELIDFCLNEVNSGHACDNFDIIYTLYYANIVSPFYREKEIQDFAEKRFWIFMEHYKENEGGFSFYPNHCNKNYYGTNITKGKNESDIHATALFMWGITLIANLLEINNTDGIYLREVIT